MLPQNYIGVDRAGDAWLAVGYEGGDGPSAAIYDTIEECWAANEDADRIVVGVPIGLLDEDSSDDADEWPRSRACDQQARVALPHRRSTVFPAPSRPAVEKALDPTATNADVSEANRAVTGKGLSAQAKGLARPIADVDELLRAGGPAVRDTLVEGHPEVCFQAFAVEDIEYSKHSAGGVLDRQMAFRQVDEYSHGDWNNLVRNLGEHAGAVGLDDLLDAMVLALTAVAPDDELQRLPVGEKPPYDAHNLPMQMVYRATSPFAALG